MPEGHADLGEYLFDREGVVMVLSSEMSSGSAEECLSEVRDAVGRAGGRIDTYRLPWRLSRKSVTELFSQNHGVLMTRSGLVTRLSGLDRPFCPGALATTWAEGEIHWLELPESLTLRTGRYSFVTIPTAPADDHDALVGRLAQWASGLSSLHSVVFVEFKDAASLGHKDVLGQRFAKALGLQIRRKPIESLAACPQFSFQAAETRPRLRQFLANLRKGSLKGFSSLAAPLVVACVGVLMARPELVSIVKDHQSPVASADVTRAPSEPSNKTFWFVVEEFLRDNVETRTTSLQRLSVRRGAETNHPDKSGSHFVLSWNDSLHRQIQDKRTQKKDVMLAFPPSEITPIKLADWKEDALRALTQKHAVRLDAERKSKGLIVKGDVLPVDRVVAFLSDPAFQYWPWLSIEITRVTDGLVRLEVVLN